MQRSKIRLLTTAATGFFCLVAATSAWAQGEPAGAPAAPPPTASPSDVPLAAGDRDIIVTATRRAERLENVPATVLAVSGVVLEQSGVTNKPAELDQDRDKMRECLGKLKGFPGVAGEITMNEVRDGAGASAILKVVNGQYVNVAK